MAQFRAFRERDMKPILCAMAALAVSTSAFAETYPDPNGPIRNGKMCWAVNDGRGFGYWDACASKLEQQEFAKKTGTVTTVDIAKSQRDGGPGGEGGGGGGAGGGGGGR
jgi:hypothetical protein